MIVITHQRDKCIGCNYCIELAPDRWVMSKKDGKCTLVGGINRKGFYTARTGNEELEANREAAKVCPVKIIQVKQI